MAKDKQPVPPPDPFGRPDPEPEQQKPAGYNAADPKQVEAAKKEAGQRRRFDRDFYQLLMSTPQRRDSFYRLLESGHIFGSYADLGTQHRAADPYVTYHQAGEENFAKRMMVAAIEASADLYLQMIKEHNAAKAAKERRDEE